MLLAHKSKLAAKEEVTLANATLESLKITKLAKTVATATITVSEETTSVAVANTAVDGAGVAAAGIKAANSPLSKNVMYTYWEDYLQFGDTTNRKTGNYANSAYTGVKEFLSYDTAHYTDQNMMAIMLHGVNVFDTIFQKYEGISIRNTKAILLTITNFISKLLVVPSALNIWVYSQQLSYYINLQIPTRKDLPPIGIIKVLP